jgi:hypothetical protein
MKIFRPISRMSSALSVAVVLSGWSGAEAEIQPAVPLTPVIRQPWTQITGDPDLGELTNAKQQPVDFAIWQAADRTWQVLECIRGTKEPGETRLL